jgi:hypothetical protein
MSSYLIETRRHPVTKEALKHASFLKADNNVHYDQYIELNLSELEPHINGPFTPDLSTPISKFAEFVEKNGWKDEIKAGLIGSCTNSSYQVSVIYIFFFIQENLIYLLTLYNLGYESRCQFSKSGIRQRNTSKRGFFYNTWK